MYYYIYIIIFVAFGANCIAFRDYSLRKFNLIWNVYASLIRTRIGICKRLMSGNLPIMGRGGVERKRETEAMSSIERRRFIV